MSNSLGGAGINRGRGGMLVSTGLGRRQHLVGGSGGDSASEEAVGESDAGGVESDAGDSDAGDSETGWLVCRGGKSDRCRMFSLALNGTNSESEDDI